MFPIPLNDVIPVALAPMSGITDQAFRRQARKFGASIVVTEMVESARFAAGNGEEVLKSAPDADSEGHVVQLAGCDTRWMAEAARRAEAAGAVMIDINMGCPAKKVVGGYAGSALMRDEGLAQSLVRAVVQAVSVPVSVKMRLGWDDTSLNAPEIARRAVEEGAAMLTVHGRTRCQFYKGSADWGAVSAVADKSTVPVVVNGDIGSPDSARDALGRSGAQGVMMGRAALGQPWILGATAAALNGRVHDWPEPSVRREAVIEHLHDSLGLYGRWKGMLMFRKHLSAYLSLEGISRAAVAAACTLEEPGLVERAINDTFERLGQGLEAA
jgi:nifR3 family TIM-barrel protein